MKEPLAVGGAAACHTCCRAAHLAARFDPRAIFNELTGDIDPAVAGYWRDHYDLSHIVERDWNNKSAPPGADLKSWRY